MIITRSFFLSNIIIFIFWSLKAFLFGDQINKVDYPIFIKSFFNPVLLLNQFLENKNIEIILSLTFCTLIGLVAFYLSLKRFENMEIN